MIGSERVVCRTSLAGDSALPLSERPDKELLLIILLSFTSKSRLGRLPRLFGVLGASSSLDFLDGFSLRLGKWMNPSSSLRSILSDANSRPSEQSDRVEKGDGLRVLLLLVKDSSSQES